MRSISITATAVWRPWGVALLTVLAAVVIFALPGASSWMQYDRILIGRGEVWRFVTSHWTHWTGEHLLWDITMFCALLICALHISRIRTIGLLAVASILIPLVVWFCLPGMMHYRGLSGLDSALYIFVASVFFKQSRDKNDRLRSFLLIGFLAGFAAKILFEIIVGRTIFVQSMGSGVVGVPLAHLAGACVGGVFQMGCSNIVTVDY